MTPEITAQQLHDILSTDSKPFLLDVREPDELEVSVLPGVVAIPMGDVPARLSEIPKDQPVVVICRSGKRSANITDLLLSHGYSDVKNLVGGMNGYATEVDPSLKVY